MKTTIPSLVRAQHACGVGLVALAAATLAPSATLQAQSVNFNSGTDTGWTRYSPLAAYGVPGVFSFPNGGYRIQTTVATGNSANPGRAGSIRMDVTYTDFYVAVDLVNWNDNTRQAFGVLGRIGTPALGQTTGYALTYERGSGVTPTSGELTLSRLTQESPTTLPSGASPIHLNPAKDYRLVFIGKGSTLQGRIYELPNTTTPLLTLATTDNTYASGYCGLVVYDNAAGTGLTDATFDNYFAAAQEPPRLAVWKLSPQQIKVGWPLEASNFTLQASPTLPTGWTDLGPGSNLGSGYWGVIQTNLANRTFYQLIKR